MIMNAIYTNKFPPRQERKYENKQENTNLKSTELNSRDFFFNNLFESNFRKNFEQISS